jgi:hypothetical protein
MTKPNFAAGLKAIKQEPPAEPPAPPKPAKDGRAGKVSIAGYFEPEVRMQLAIMAARQRKTQVELMAEAYNLLFEKYGESPIARA